MNSPGAEPDEPNSDSKSNSGIASVTFSVNDTVSDSAGTPSSITVTLIG